MKPLKLIALSVVPASIAAGLLISCASSPPSKIESTFFDVTTNQLPRLVVITNVIPVYQTNLSNIVISTWQTNVALITNYIPGYTFTPNTNAAQVAQTASSVANIFGPWGSLVGLIIGGAFSVWAGVRSTGIKRDYTAMEQTAGALAQIIEVGRQVLQTTPQGQKLDVEWKSWMVQHQAEAGVFQNVVKLLGSVVNDESAKVAAGKIVELIQPTKP